MALDSSALVASPLREEIKELDSTPSLELQSAPVEEIKQLGEKSTPISGKNDTVLLVPDQSLSSSQRLDLPLERSASVADTGDTHLKKQEFFYRQFSHPGKPERRFPKSTKPMYFGLSADYFFKF